MQEDGSLVSVLRRQGCELYDLTDVAGQIYCVGRSQGKDILFCADSQKQELETAVNLPDSKGTVMLRLGPDNTVLYGYYDAIYQYDLEKGEGKDIYAWTNAVIRDSELLVMNEILTEEITDCFSGGRSVEETAAMIQNRVQLYLDENL